MQKLFSQIKLLVQQLLGSTTKYTPPLVTDLTPSDEIKDFIKGYEKLKLKAYLPTKNDVPTIGYGSTKGVRMGDTITKEEAEELFIRDLYEVAVNPVKTSVTASLDQQQFDAVVSLVYNVGIGAFVSSKAFDALEDGRFDDFVKEAFDEDIGFVKQRGRKLKGLVKRRNDERNIFENGEYRRS